MTRASAGCARRSRSSYVYRWFGEGRTARFDAGLVNPNGSPRKAYSVFARFAKTHR